MAKTSSPVILLTRPREASQRFAMALESRLGDVPMILSPVLEIAYLRPEALPQASALIFTSAHGVEGYRRAQGPARCAFCVGARTAEAARENGHEIAGIAQDVAELEKILPRPREGLLHVRGRHVAAELANAHAGIDEVIVYDQLAKPLTSEAKRAFAGDRSLVLPLFSPRSARELARQVSGSAPRLAAFMSPAVRAAFAKVELRKSALAERPDAEAMLEATAALYDAAYVLERRDRGE